MWTHTDGSFIFLDSRNNALVILFIARVDSGNFSINIVCLIISILPLVTWIYGLIDWMQGGYQIQLLMLESVAICEYSNNYMDCKDFAVLQ